MTAVILRPVCVAMCEKVRKSHFLAFEFDFCQKETSQRARMDVYY